MASFLWFIFGCALGSAVFGMLAWAEEMKGKRLLSLETQARIAEQKHHRLSVKRLETIYNQSVKELYATYNNSISELKSDLAPRNELTVKKASSRDLN